VDDDGSPDGVIALLYMLRHPHYDVQAVTVSCGEAHPDIFARHLAHLLAVMGHSDIPVGAGRDAPLEGSNAFPDPWRRASDDFWGLDLPQASHPAEPVPAAQLIVHILSTSTQPVLLLVTGNHTNLAEALRLQPDIADRILGVHVMGGSIHTPGNIETDWPDIHNRVAEWNIWVDPKAASEVLAAGLPVGITPLDATNQVTWNRSDALAWASSPLPEARLAAELLEWMLDSWSVSGVFVWDLVAALDATDPDLCPEAWLALEVVTEPGPEQGRTAVTGGPPNAAVCLNPDADQIRARAASILGR
jgi:purine nucleosidase/pyrimidine-specific ribonucleoside hydrolase